MIDPRVGREAQEGLTTGAAIAGMLLNGGGLAERARSLPPPFCAHKPVGVRCRDGVSAAPGHRGTLGRSRDTTFSSGGDTCCSEVALAVGQQAEVARTFPWLETTSGFLTGASGPAPDAQATALTDGSAKEHRPDWQPAVRAVRVAHDGGGPLMRQRWDGPASETVVGKARGEALRTQGAAREPPRDVRADAHVSTAAHASNGARLPGRPRIPATCTVTPPVLAQAWAWGAWPPLEETVQDQRGARGQDGMAPRGLVVASQDAWHRAEQPLAQAQAPAAAQVPHRSGLSRPTGCPP
jgi:hypothetical protein